MAPDDLDRSLRDGKDDLDRITGRKTLLVRPPYWRFNPSTLLRYGQHGLHMVLSDVKAFDGINWGIHMLKRWNFRSQLSGIRTRFLRGDLPVVNHTLPVVVTFHDTNAFTAAHLSDYLSLLVEESRRLGFPLHRKPFLDSHRDLLEAGLRRAAFPPSVTHSDSLFAEAQ
jgi:peptidoglycan/xylan/chitin deacetylase (PgdA/CDA1 family)